MGAVADGMGAVAMTCDAGVKGVATLVADMDSIEMKGDGSTGGVRIRRPGGAWWGREAWCGQPGL